MPDPVDFALDVFPALLEPACRSTSTRSTAYWNDIGTLREYLQGNLDAARGRRLARLRRRARRASGRRRARSRDGSCSARVPRSAPAPTIIGPVVIGPGAEIGAGAQVKEAVLLPGAAGARPASILARGIAGDAARLASGDW